MQDEPSELPNRLYQGEMQAMGRRPTVKAGGDRVTNSSAFDPETLEIWHNGQNGSGFKMHAEKSTLARQKVIPKLV